MEHTFSRREQQHRRHTKKFLTIEMVSHWWIMLTLHSPKATQKKITLAIFFRGSIASSNINRYGNVTFQKSQHQSDKEIKRAHTHTHTERKKKRRTMIVYENGNTYIFRMRMSRNNFTAINARGTATDWERKKEKKSHTPDIKTHSWCDSSFYNFVVSIAWIRN